MDKVAALKVFNATFVGVNFSLALLSLFGAYWSWRERKRSAYVWFYEIIANHHSADMTKLRGEVLGQAAEKLASARDQGLLLEDADPEFATRLSSLINYYEGLGMFLKGAWKLFPEAARNVMREMLNNSVGTTYRYVNEYADQIRPNRPADWAAGLTWLYRETEDMRQQVAQQSSPLGRP